MIKKTFLLLLLVIMVASTTQAQSVEDFLALRNDNIEEVNLRLSNLNWQLYDEDEQRKGDIIVYTYKNENDIDAMLGIQWIDYVNRPKHYNKNRLSFQVQNKELYEQFVNEIKTLGFYYIYQKNVYDNDVMLYSNSDVTIEIIESKSKYMYDSGTYYNFAFYNKLEYEVVFKDENPLENNPFTSISLYNKSK